MRALRIYERDLTESFIRASGPGGQNVNKVSTCVVLSHQPTGMMVKCQRERTQGLNRYRARCMLVDKIEKQQHDLAARKQQARAKKRRQNRRRSKASKENMLKEKKQRSQKKKGRQRISTRNKDAW